MSKKPNRAIAFDWITLVILFVGAPLAVVAGCELAHSAPVPKVPTAPKTLTAEQVVGTWEYSWSTMHNGVIAFNADGTYAAQHILGSDVMYSGTWKVEDSTVTITEYTYTISTGTRCGGPTDYRFAFDLAKYPTLVGKSNGSTDVKITNPKR